MKSNIIVGENRSYQMFCCPYSHEALESAPNTGLMNARGDIFNFADDEGRVVDFIDIRNASKFDLDNRNTYDVPASIDVYRNFLDWLFATFNENEADFRRNLVNYLNLSPGAKVLITGCGFGDDIAIISELIGVTGEIHAQDLSKSMILRASEIYTQPNIYYSISNATSLPYISRYFDAVFHFGGINMFGDVNKAISEMERVCKVGGKVVFGDEGIATHLRDTQYAKVAITNNQLWSMNPPMNCLPYNATDIMLFYVLGNCFYVICFSPSDGLPKMDIDIPHKGLRGGTARTRYFGQVEGLTLDTKMALTEAAKQQGESIHNLLEEAVKNFIEN